MKQKIISGKIIFKFVLVQLFFLLFFSLGVQSVDAAFANCPGDTVNGWWDISNTQTINTTANITCEYINISNGGRLYVNSSIDNLTVYITVGNLTVQKGGEINGSGTGFSNASGEGKATVTASNPGGGGGGPETTPSTTEEIPPEEVSTELGGETSGVEEQPSEEEQTSALETPTGGTVAGELFGKQEQEAEKQALVETPTSQLLLFAKRTLLAPLNLFLLGLLIPLLFVMTARKTYVDEKGVAILIEHKKIPRFKKLYVHSAVYDKYKELKEGKRLKPLHLKEKEKALAMSLSDTYHVAPELAALLASAQRNIFSSVLTEEILPKEVRKKLSHVHLKMPIRDKKLEKLLAYFEAQEERGFSTLDIRHALLSAGWGAAVVNKMLHAEQMIGETILLAEHDGKSQSEIKQELLGAGWEKELVEQYVPKEKILQEYISLQRKQGVPDLAIAQALLIVGWQQSVFEKFINMPMAFTLYVDAQKREGKTFSDIRKELLQSGWDMTFVNQYIPVASVVREIITIERRARKDDLTIKKQLLQSGYDPLVVNTFFSQELELQNYIKKQLQTRMHPDMIRSKLLAVGWQQKIVDKYLPSRSSTAPVFSLQHSYLTNTVHQIPAGRFRVAFDPHAVSPKQQMDLEKYVKLQKNRGKETENIKATLLQAGWSTDVAHYFVDNIKKEG